MKIIEHQGWGRKSKTKSKSFAFTEFSQDLRNETNSGLAIGLGRSYGDCSINSTGVYFSTESKKHINIDVSNQTATCEAGATIGDLERCAINFGLFPPVVPGTEFVTIGGAIASNIHGKSHHSVGSFGSIVTKLTLITSNGETLNLSPDGPSKDKFWATVGGMGLTGVITQATVKLIEIKSSYVRVREQRANNLDELMKLLEMFDKKYLYTVAWLDMSGKFTGRGRVLGANHASIEQIQKKHKKSPFKISRTFPFSLPDIFPSNLINSITVTAFNNIWFYKPLKNGISNLKHFFHPLDSVQNWNRIYGKKGFIQYQFQISSGDTFFLRDILSQLKKFKINSFLAVLKKFGASDKSYLGFAAPGWTLTIDIPANNRNDLEFLRLLTKKLLQVNGKVYLAKDSVIRKEEFQMMYPRHQEWKKIKEEMDPHNYWVSDQGIRLGLC